MTERLSPDRRPSDDDLINAEIDTAIEMETNIGSAAARVIASQIDAGPTSALHSFVTTGAIADELIHEIEVQFQMAHHDEDLGRKIAFLSTYVAERWCTDKKEAVENWHKLWLEASPEIDLCPVCHETIYNNHRVGCPLGEDDEEQLDRVIALGQEHGEGLLHYAAYRGFRNLEELEQVASDFNSGAYYGHFMDIDTFNRHYDADPNELIEQQYHIAEALDGTLHIFAR